MIGFQKNENQQDHRSRIALAEIHRLQTFFVQSCFQFYERGEKEAPWCEDDPLCDWGEGGEKPHQLAKEFELKT